MSYLDVPRIHFAGRFFTDPSTVNNDPTHYDPNVTTPSPWQEPNGQHRFMLSDCIVSSAVDQNGFVENDTIIAAAVISTNLPDPARIVDLDVYQQGVPTIIGMQIQITLSDGHSITGIPDSSGNNCNMDGAVLNGLWFNSVLPTRGWDDSDYDQDSYGGDMNAAGYFQTVVRFNSANWPTSSSILTQLKAKTLTVNNEVLFSFRFVLDGYRNVPEDMNFRTGRIVGTFGPVFNNEPLYNAGQRWMQPRAFAQTDPWNFPSFNPATFKVDKTRNKLVIDLANSICRIKAAGGPVDLGTLTAYIGSTTAIGAVDYSEFSYENNADIVELPLTQQQIQLLDTQALSLKMSRTDLGAQVVLDEGTVKPQYAVEVRPIRMQGAPGTTATTQVYVSLNGAPVANKQLYLEIVSVHGNTPGATVPPTNPGNTPQADNALDAKITTTDQYGFATVTLTVLKDPGYRTKELDGQLYFVIVNDSLEISQGAPVQEHLISVVVFSNYAVNQNPTWQDIVDIFAPYMKLYPFMKNRIDLTDPHTFQVFGRNPPWTHGYNSNKVGPLGITAGAIPWYLCFEWNDPRYMPVTRDLSDNKITTVFYYIKNMQATPPPPGTDQIPANWRPSTSKVNA